MLNVGLVPWQRVLSGGLILSSMSSWCALYQAASSETAREPRVVVQEPAVRLLAGSALTPAEQAGLVAACERRFKGSWTKALVHERVRIITNERINVELEDGHCFTLKHAYPPRKSVFSLARSKASIHDAASMPTAVHARWQLDDGTFMPEPFVAEVICAVLFTKRSLSTEYTTARYLLAQFHEVRAACCIADDLAGTCWCKAMTN